MKLRVFCISLALAASLPAQTSPAARQIASAITADGLKAEISFLASDAMKGRATPSGEQDIAAEYIASEFRRAGLEPVGDDAYFQTAALESVTSGQAPLELTLVINGQSYKVAPEAMQCLRERALTLNAAEAAHPALPLTAEALAQVKGKPLILDSQRASNLPADSPLAILVMPAGQPLQRSASRASLRMPGQQPSGPAVIAISDEVIRKALAAPGATIAVTAKIGEPAATPLKLRNVVGLLRGADPALKDEVLIVSAHYDHLGVRAGQPDTVFNGANDNASGAAAVMEMARALAALPERPKRSVLFLALFGEEVGEVGSAWYGKHPLFPLEKTIADINLEQLGRTDDTEGPKLKQFNLTGFDYSNIASFFTAAGKEFAVTAVKHEKNSDSFFARSDNAAFSNLGVPSTTVSVSYVFPDYHAVGDEWQKIDYPNMALVTRTLALGAYDMANAAQAPAWNQENSKTDRYRKARATK